MSKLFFSRLIFNVLSIQLLLKYNVDIYLFLSLGHNYFVQYANNLIKKIIIQMVYLQDVRIYIYTTVYIQSLSVVYRSPLPLLRNCGGDGWAVKKSILNFLP